MNKMLEDRLGKFAMLLIFGYFGLQHVLSFAGSVSLRQTIPLWQIALLAQLAAILFMCLVLFFTATRLPPRDSAEGIMPRLVAIAGTFAMMLLILLPPEPISPTQRIVSASFSVVGTLLSSWCLFQLGRSFSIMASSRELRTEGSYSLVRHPLYGAEVVMIFGVILSHGSPLAYGVGIVWLLLQIRRAQFEETVLRRTFPEYADYARRVPMLIPGIRLPFLESSDKPDPTV